MKSRSTTELVHSEHAAEDDAAIEKRARDVVTGVVRQKRRNGGVDVDDSEEDEEEAERNRHLRSGLKRRKIAGDKLEDLGE